MGLASCPSVPEKRCRLNVMANDKIVSPETDAKFVRGTKEWKARQKRIKEFTPKFWMFASDID
tara:strand:- start:461 stop:649 length:189 start_codon:yes stop_codon:yes gene_type:complete